MKDYDRVKVWQKEAFPLAVRRPRSTGDAAPDRLGLDHSAIDIWSQPNASRVDRLDLATGARTLLTDIPSMTANDVSGLRLADDPRSYVYQRSSRRSQLFTVKGAR